MGKVLSGQVIFHKEMLPSVEILENVINSIWGHEIEPQNLPYV